MKDSNTNVMGDGGWSDGTLPPNLRLGKGTLLQGHLACKRFHNLQPDALVIEQGSTMDGVHFDVGAAGRMRLGDYCYHTNAVLLRELEIIVGNHARFHLLQFGSRTIASTS